jgi:predicted Rossmann-fold nucleotide-binding protein
VAEQLGRRLAQEKIGVVYGAGGVGVMGALSDAVLEAGGKPIVVLDTEGYYRPLMTLLDHGVAEGFMTRRDRRLLRVAPTIAAALRLLRAGAPEPTDERLDLTAT